MAYPFTNRKRIRGWPRMLQKLDALERQAIALDLDQLRRAGWCSYELMLAPFSNLTPRNPPGWYARRYFESMLRVMNSWQESMVRDGSDFYLAAWCFNPRFSKSQIVAALGDRAAYYRSLFRDRTDSPNFPQAIQKFRSQFPWKSKWDLEPYHTDADELKKSDMIKLKRLSALEEKYGHERVFLIPRGTVWVFEMTG